jgi:toxin ParE1/3/4
MNRSRFGYELSEKAEQDLEEIFDYTALNFGIDQAIAYVSGFEDLFVNLSNNPELGRKRDEIRSGLRSYFKESHIVFYRVLRGRIRIVRILHGSRDLIKFL